MAQNKKIKRGGRQSTNGEGYNNRSANGGARDGAVDRGRSSNRRKQPTKDSRQKRINMDNERVATFVKDMEKDHSNDVSWYTHNPELLKSAGSYGFSYLTGQKLGFTGFNWGTSTVGQTVPGVMAFYWTPAYGGANIRAINQSANALYSYVVHANSRNKSYDANDLMLTILATEQVFSMLASMIRAYGVARNYSDRDIYTPDALLKAMGFVPTNIRASLATMWFDINEFVSRVVQLWIPKNLPFVARQFWMNTNVYKDSQTAKAQYYLYVQNRYFRYNEKRFDTGGCLEPAMNGNTVFSPGNGNTYNWSVWKTVLNDMIDQLLNSQDRGIMLGDVLKAYGKENLYSLNEVDVNYRVDYTYNPEVLSQFENLTVHTGYSRIMGLFQASPAAGTVESFLESYYNASADDTWNQVGSGHGNQLVLNFHQNETPSPEQIMVATRMSASSSIGQLSYTVASLTGPTTGSDTAEQKYVLWLPDSTGTEVCTAVAVYYNYANNTNYKTITLSQMGAENTAINPELVYLWNAFDWAPWMYFSEYLVTTSGKITVGATTNISMAIGDWDNYTILTAPDMLKLNTAAVYSEFGVPVL